MFIDRDLYEWYERRLQCSYQCELRRLDEIPQSPTLKDKRPVGVS